MVIRYMETDKGHIHYMIETEPTMSVGQWGVHQNSNKRNGEFS